MGFSALKTESRKIHPLFFLSLKKMRAYEIKKSIVETESRKFARQKKKKETKKQSFFFFHGFENIDRGTFI